MRAAGRAVSLLGLAAGVACSGQGRLMDRYLLPKGTEGGLCMDGSPAGWYYAAPKNTSSTVWVINLEGGGYCHSKGTCDKWAKKSGSSDKWKAQDHQDEFLDDDPNNNPDFHDAYAIDIPYCTADGHAGQRTTADESTWGYYFSGRKNVEKIMSALLADSTIGPKLKAATQVLVTGPSAGGIGSFKNTDYIASVLSWAKVKCVPRAGWFVPGHTEDQPGHPELPPSSYGNWTQNKTGNPSQGDPSVQQAYIDPECAKAYPSNPFLCSSVTNLYPFIKTPLFILENNFDTEQLQGQFGCDTSKAKTDKEVQAYIGYWGRAMRASITKESLKAGDGAFIPSCLDHGDGLGLKNEGHRGTPSTIAGAPSQQELVGDWFFERGAYNNYYYVDTCGDLPCNPTCTHITP